ncbi:MAG: phosphate ABC transporter substrate-binding protein PstS [Bacteroidota bacterium]|nr:phosphate ABC transporter substrate-binding protein PstS [Candidatus Kapabacteria bacterium]MCS7303155.1 phosphate ABC transporter substrate-binding protein PstS [Candidatus Kapabacteria bacterium]MDW8075852.1 phosphate ABC transporter substrate-binding protein PstS [Bacteroidota bacterium]MDW8271828.1 phosphate ABC transporter substrate-binding protein PstS [Bacteroidota bacterium]
MRSAIVQSFLLGILTVGLSAQPLQLNGAGATFPYVLYSKWFDVYHKKTGIQFNYQSIGSGGGIKQITDGTIDFGASDGPMTDEQLALARTKRGTNILHIPTTLGAVVVAYNLPLEKPLRLTPAVLADIFLGVIKRWNDQRIADINPGVKLPAKPIVVVHRSDGSGTTAIFTDYLCKISNYWKQKYGQGTSVSWPKGTLGAKGNEGVAGQIRQIQGSIGYIELAYAVQNKLPYAAVQNSSGEFVLPALENVTLAAESMLQAIPEDLRASITNSPRGYPISGLTWLLVLEQQPDRKKGKALVDFLRWALTDGQKYCAELHYAPLPKAVAERALKKVSQIRVP